MSQAGTLCPQLAVVNLYRHAQHGDQVTKDSSFALLETIAVTAK